MTRRAGKGPQRRTGNLREKTKTKGLFNTKQAKSAPKAQKVRQKGPERYLRLGG